MKNLYKGLGFLVLSTILLTPFSAFAATNEGVATASNVLVVYNSAYITDSNSDSVQDSLELANYYKAKRNIPDVNVVGIDTPTTLAITRSDYNSYIKSPLEAYLTDNNLKDSIKYIVLVYGIPMKVYDTSGAANNYINSAGNHSSVDASTVFLFQTNYSSTDGKIINPYYNADPNLDLNNRFKSNTFGTDVKLQYLVTRLDGYTVQDVKNMIDRAYNTDKSGTGYFVLDNYSGGNNFNFDTMANAATSLKNIGKNIYPDPFTTGSSATKNISGNVMGYASYGIYAGLDNDFYNNDLDFAYSNGAVATTNESYTAFSNVEPDNTNFGQIYQFIRAGGSGGIGNVYEPFTNGLPKESVYMPAYSVGYTWADAAYMSLSLANWQAIVIGDPLMRIVTDSISAPSVTTVSATNTTIDSVTLTGNISNTGGEDNTVRGFKYGTTNAYGNFVKESGSFGAGNFSLNLTNLSCGTTYYYQSYSTNSFRSGFGSSSTFTTTPCGVPTISTDSPSDTTVSSAKLNATITNIGQGAVTERGFEFGLTSQYGSTTTEGGSFSAGGFSITVTGLLCNTTYHYRAFATNSAATTYGDDMTFTTSYDCAPTISTNIATLSSGTSYNFNADITSVGGDSVTERGFQIGATTNYGTTVKQNGNFGGSFGYVSKFGSYGSGDGQFVYPRSVALDSNNNIYVVDRLNHNVQKFDSAGNFITKWGSFGSGNSQFKYPRGIAVDSNNNIYIADSDNHKIKKFDSSGNYITSWGGYGTGNGKTSYPQDIAIDANNNIYVSDYDNSRITKFSATGSYITKWGSYGSGDGQFKPAYDLAVDSSGNVYVADRNNNRIQKFDSAGNFILKFGSLGNGQGQFSLPHGIVIDSDDNIYVTDNNNYLQKFDSNGSFMARTGGTGGVNGFFSDPQGLDIDSSNNIYVADSSNSRIQKISTTGLFSILVNNLTCATSYSYRAYALNAIGTSYGSNINFTTPACPIYIAPPAGLVTVSSTNITQNQATLKGNLGNYGGSKVTNRGFEYGTTSSLGQILSQTGLFWAESYTLPLNNLTCGTTYYYRAYATNPGGTAYGKILSFVTGACVNTDFIAPVVTTLSPNNNSSNIDVATNLTISFNESVKMISGNIVIKKDSDDSVVEIIPASSGLITGGNTNTITINPSVTLNTSTKYYIIFEGQVFSDLANNIYSGITQKTDWAFTTVQAIYIAPPAGLVTVSSTNITQNQATLKGNLGNFGGSRVTNRGFEYGTTSSLGQILSQTGLFWAESYTLPLNNLTCGTTYYYRAYATNPGGTAYGRILSFVTGACVNI